MLIVSVNLKNYKKKLIFNLNNKLKFIEKENNLKKISKKKIKKLF
jgi:hypothetical protein